MGYITGLGSIQHVLPISFKKINNYIFFYDDKNIARERVGVLDPKKISLFPYKTSKSLQHVWCVGGVLEARWCVAGCLGIWVICLRSTAPLVLASVNPSDTDISFGKGAFSGHM